MSYISGKIIKELREKKKITQKQLADMLQVSDKTISKWENDRGLPDISLINDLSKSLGVSVTELMMGEYIENDNRHANMKNVNFYVCPVCKNIIQAVGKGSYSCCGITLPALEIEEKDEEHKINVEIIENDYFIQIDHPMTKEHYISFIAFVTSSHMEIVKLYPEQNAEWRLSKKGHGYIYIYCNKHGLYRILV